MYIVHYHYKGETIIRVICSKCERSLELGEKYIPVSVKYPKRTRFQIYGLTFLNFCTGCAVDLNIIKKVN